MERHCKHHGLTKHRLEGSAQHLRCVKCRTQRISDARRSLKRELVVHLGGKCRQCGYDRSIWSLDFHHRDASEKEYAMGVLIRDRKRDLAFQEARKCDLVCSNCHGELEEQIYVERSRLKPCASMVRIRQGTLFSGTVVKTGDGRNDRVCLGLAPFT
jgi:hypothetical protein